MTKPAKIRPNGQSASYGGMAKVSFGRRASSTIHAANNVLNIAAIESMQRAQQYGKNYLGAVLNKVEMDVLEM